MHDITLREGEAKLLPYTLVYGANHSLVQAGTRAAGSPIFQADLFSPAPRLWWYVKVNESDASPIISLKDDNSAQIQWDSINGEITVKLSAANTKQSPSVVGNGLYYELRAKFADGTYQTLRYGRMDILESIVDIH